MASERLPTRKAQEILRLKWELRLSNRDAARSAGVSPATVVNVVRRASAASITSYTQAGSLSETELEAALYPQSAGSAVAIARTEPAEGGNQSAAQRHRSSARGVA